MKTYQTISGDTWDKIALSELGSALLTEELMKANLDHIQTTVFPAGALLSIPDVEEQVSTNLPPWKRVES
jgi:phage tail protein X